MLIVTSGAALAPRTASPSPPSPAGTSGGALDGTAAAGVSFQWNPALHDWVVRWEDVLPLQAVLGAGSYGKVCVVGACLLLCVVWLVYAALRLHVEVAFRPSSLFNQQPSSPASRCPAAPARTGLLGAVEPH